MRRTLWVSAGPWPSTDQDLADASAAGAAEIMHAGDPALDTLGITGTGYFETDPDPVTAEPSLEDLRAQVQSILQQIEAKLAAEG